MNDWWLLLFIIGIILLIGYVYVTQDDIDYYKIVNGTEYHCMGTRNHYEICDIVGDGIGYD